MCADERAMVKLEAAEVADEQTMTHRTKAPS